MFFINALVLWVVVLADVWLTNNVTVFSNWYFNLFLWSAVLTAILGFVISPITFRSRNV